MSRSRTAWIVSLLIAFSQSAVATRDAQSNRNEPMGQPQIDRVAPREDGDPERIQAPVLSGYVVEKIADTSTPLPAGTGAFAAFGVPSIDGGTVAFRADGDMGQKGVYALVGNTLTKVADLDTPIPGGAGNFTYFENVALDGQVSVSSDGSVAFIGQSDAGGSHRMGIYTNKTGPLSILVDNTFPVPRNPAGTFGNFFMMSSDGGQVAFTAVSDGFLQGLYLADRLHGLARGGLEHTYPGGHGQFHGLRVEQRGGASFAPCR